MRALVIVFCAVAANTPVEQLAREADKARDAGDLESSLTLLERAYAIDPLPVLLNNIARAHEALGRYRKAAEVYQRVIDDRRTEPELVALDVQRLRALEPKLSRAWIQIAPSIADEHLLIDGRSPRTHPLPGGKKEIELDPGRHVFEYSPDPTTAVLEFRTLAADTSTIGFDGGGWGSISLRGIHARSIEINRYTLRAPLAALERIRARAVRYNLEIRLEDGSSLAGAIEVRADEEAELTVPVAVEAPRVVEPVRETTFPWAAISIGAGGIALGIAGGALAVIAEGHRSRVRTAIEDGPSPAQLSMRDAVELEDRANVEAGAGAVLIGAGITAIATGLVWWMLDGESSSSIGEP